VLSGIGDPDELDANGVTSNHALHGVGQNLQDHAQARLVFKCNEPTLNDEVRSLANQARIALKYAFARTGPMTMAASLATGFLKTHPEVATPDIQFHVQPWSADSPGEGVHPFSAFTMFGLSASSGKLGPAQAERSRSAVICADRAPLSLDTGGL